LLRSALACVLLYRNATAQEFPITARVPLESAQHVSKSPVQTQAPSGAENNARRMSGERIKALIAAVLGDKEDVWSAIFLATGNGTYPRPTVISVLWRIDGLRRGTTCTSCDGRSLGKEFYTRECRGSYKVRQLTEFVDRSNLSGGLPTPDAHKVSRGLAAGRPSCSLASIRSPFAGAPLLVKQFLFALRR
jgi:hypothetical protein